MAAGTTASNAANDGGGLSSTGVNLGTNGFEEKRARRFKSGPLPDWCEAAGGQVLAAGEELQKTFASLREHVLE